jgi:hypothetical protein
MGTLCLLRHGWPCRLPRAWSRYSMSSRWACAAALRVVRGVGGSVRQGGNDHKNAPTDSGSLGRRPDPEDHAAVCEIRPLLGPPVNQEVGGSNPPAGSPKVCRSARRPPKSAKSRPILCATSVPTRLHSGHIKLTVPVGARAVGRGRRFPRVAIGSVPTRRAVGPASRGGTPRTRDRR